MVLHLDCLRMHGDGGEFYLLDNDLWLTNWVDAKYLSALGAVDAPASVPD